MELDYGLDSAPSVPKFELETPGIKAITELTGADSALTIVFTNVTEIEHPQEAVHRHAESKRGGDLVLSRLTVLAPAKPIYNGVKLANVMTSFGKELGKIEHMGTFTLQQALSYSRLSRRVAPVVSAGKEAIGLMTTTQSFVPFEDVSLPEQTADWHGGKGFLTHHLALYPDGDMARMAMRKVGSTVKVNGEFFKPARLALARA